MKNGERKLRFITHFVLLLVAALIPNNVTEISVNRRLCIHIFGSCFDFQFLQENCRGYYKRVDKRLQICNLNANAMVLLRFFYYLTHSNAPAT